MYITYRDHIGTVTVEIIAAYGISFSDGNAYFSGTDGIDYQIPLAVLEAVNE